MAPQPGMIRKFINEPTWSLFQTDTAAKSFVQKNTDTVGIKKIKSQTVIQ